MNREAFAARAPRPFPIALLVLPPIGLAWLVARATSTDLVEQIALVAFIPPLALVLFGPRAARPMAFPLLFLFLAVPFGDTFQPSLMGATADFAVRALRLSGVPVVREGVFITSPIAQWRVAEACSGLRYLVSGFALACLFAYITYRRPWKRAVCLLLSLIVLVFANGFRAYVLILTEYMSEMRFGRGFDHYALGWGVYILVMVAFFAAGSAFRDPPAPGKDAGLATGPEAVAPTRAERSGWIAVAAVAVALILFWPGYLYEVSRPGSSRPAAPILPPAPGGGWEARSEPAPAWKPDFSGASSQTALLYAKGGATVTCTILFYEHQTEGKEMIRHRNVIARVEDPVYPKLEERVRNVPLDRGTLAVRETEIGGPDHRFVTWDWYWFPDEFTISPVWAKVLQARADLLLRRDQAAVIVLSTPAANAGEAAQPLGEFVRDMLPSIRAALQTPQRPR